MTEIKLLLNEFDKFALGDDFELWKTATNFSQGPDSVDNQSIFSKS